MGVYDDLISRQAVIDIAMQYCPDDDGSCSKAGADIREMLDELESLPSAQPERRTGEWVHLGGDEWVCSARIAERKWRPTMARLIDADKLIDFKFAYITDERYKDGRRKSEEEIYAYKVGYNTAIDNIIQFATTVDVVEIKEDGEWEMFDLISSAYYGKGMYFKQDDGTVYSRYSCKYMSVDEAIREFVSLIDGTEANDGEIH